MCHDVVYTEDTRYRRETPAGAVGPGPIVAVSDSSSPASALAIHLWAVCLLTPASRATADTLSPARTSSTSLCRPRGASRELERWSKGPLSLQPSTSHSLEESSPFVTSCVNNLLAHDS